MLKYPDQKKHDGTNLFLGRIKNLIQLQSCFSLQSCLGNKPRNPSRNQERMMEQDAKRVGRQALEP